MADGNWYYAVGGQQQGPVSVDDIQRLLAANQMQPGDLVWREGMPTWTPAGEVPELASAARTEPAPAGAAAAPAEPAAPGPAEWHYAHGGQQHGPVPADTVRQLLASRQLDPGALVWRDGMPAWAAAGAVPELSRAVPQGADPYALADPAAGYGSPSTGYAAPSPATPGHYAPQQMNYYQPGQTLQYGGFWLRFVASIIDSLIVFVPLFVVGMLAAMAVGVDPTSTNPNQGPSGPAIIIDLLLRVVGLVVGWLYSALQESGPRQATLGKRALGLIVTDMQGGRLTFGRASGRYFAKIISNLTCGIGYIIAGFTERKQALHDMVASTLVMKRS